MPPVNILDALRRGCVIPASPLALDGRGAFDERYQRAVYRYYSAAGAGGIAVGVHTTQFEIRDAEINLFDRVLGFASEVMDDLDSGRETPLIRIAGVCGQTVQAVGEAGLAAKLGYHAGLLSLAGHDSHDEKTLIKHCRLVAEKIPLVGFYLQPAVGGRFLSHAFWRDFVRIPNVVAIKVAPFNRYQTLDVVRAIAMEGKENDIALYTGNDDSIIADLMIPYQVQGKNGRVTLRFCGGLLGQWSVWTSSMVALLRDIHRVVKVGSGDEVRALLVKNGELTDANAAVFDAANAFSGCIPGINEILRRQGLLPSRRCLDVALELSPGQAEELDRVRGEYPWLVDDDFVATHLEEWLS
ncbi:MAG: dihydrodipicolinate synthase family protein [Candidatus Sumerlaeia bacterium]|nr:dihydrodipicolinate synthase family protein [Candidatus Sumerlaeia bacterium]